MCIDDLDRHLMEHQSVREYHRSGKFSDAASKGGLREEDLSMVAEHRECIKAESSKRRYTIKRYQLTPAELEDGLVGFSHCFVPYLNEIDSSRHPKEQHNPQPV